MSARGEHDAGRDIAAVNPRKGGPRKVPATTSLRGGCGTRELYPPLSAAGLDLSSPADAHCPLSRFRCGAFRRRFDQSSDSVRLGDVDGVASLYLDKRSP